jgi:hypothetical protein
VEFCSLDLDPPEAPVSQSHNLAIISIMLFRQCSEQQRGYPTLIDFKIQKIKFEICTAAMLEILAISGRVM